jgi:hypothetical protein
MKKHINHLFSTVKDKHRTYPKFLVSSDEPHERPVLDAARETSNNLENQMTASRFGQKKHIRRYARFLRQHDL